MRQTLTAAVLAIGLALGAAACASSDDTNASPSPTTSGVTSLEGTSWVLVSYSTSDASPATDVPEGARATAVFADQRISGSDGCNNYTGRYEAVGGSIAIDSLASTQRACTGPAAEVSSDFLLALGAADEYTVTSEALTLKGTDVQGRAVSLVFAPEVALPLEGTVWNATGINNGKQAVASLVADTAVTATFGSDGTISGNAGCNSYTAPFTLDDATVDIGSSVTTEIACSEPIAQQESAYLAALEAATTYTISGESMELRDDQGALQVGYNAR